MEEKSIIIIGNGGSILDTNLGTKIDRFDEVMRINDAFTIGYESDVGNKTTIWSTYNPDKKFNKYIRHFNKMENGKEKLRESVKNIKEIWYASPLESLLKPWKYRILGIRNKIKRYESIETLRDIEKIQHHPTTGFILINLMLLSYDKVYTAGFDFNGRKKEIDYSHYYATFKSTKEEENPHNLDKELQWILKNEEEGNIIDLQSDTNIIKSKLLEDMINRKCNICKKESLYYSWENDICHYCESYL